MSLLNINNSTKKFKKTIKTMETIHVYNTFIIVLHNLETFKTIWNFPHTMESVDNI